MEKLWNVAEPCMFGLIGAEIDISTLDPPTVGKMFNIPGRRHSRVTKTLAF